MAPLPPRIANLNRLPPSPPRNPFQSLNPAPHAEADLVLDAALARQLELWTNVDFTFDDGDMTHGGTFGSRAPTDASRMSPLKEEEDKEMGLEEIFQGKVKQRNMNRNLLMDEMEQREIANGTPQQEGPWWTGLPKNQQRNSAPPPQPIHNPPPSISLPAPIPSLPFPPDPNMQAQTVALANDPNFAAFVAAFSAAAALQQQQQNSTQTPTPQTAHASSSRLPSTRRESSSQPSSSKRPSVVIHQSAAPTPEEEDSPPGKKAKMMGPDGIMIDAVQVGDEIITIEEEYVAAAGHQQFVRSS